MIGAGLEGPELATVLGSQQRTARYDATFGNMRLDFPSGFDDITVKGGLAAVRAASQGTITIRATGETTQPARLRQLFVLERIGGHWKITKYLPEQSGGGCSGI